MNLFRKLQGKICSLLVVAMFGMSVQGTVFAGIVTTPDIVDAQQIQVERDRIKQWMARDEVRDQLTSMGVSAEDASKRVDSMTDEEVISLAANMDEMPAGSSTGEVVLIAVLVLVILELTGVTDIFTFI